MSKFIRVTFPSPISFKEICIGGIYQTPKGRFLPKIRVTTWTYQNIKNGVAQPTQDEAIDVLIRSYYESTGDYKGWTTEEVEKRLSKAYRVVEAEEQKRLALEAENEARKQRDEARKQRDRERSRAYPSTVQVIRDLRYFNVSEITFPDKTIYKVTFKKVKGWRKVCNAIAQLKLGPKTQSKWHFDTLDAALNFLSLTRTQIEINTNSSLSHIWNEPSTKRTLCAVK